MSLGIRIVTIVLVVADLGFCIIHGLRASGKIENVDEYYIAGKKTNTIFLALTMFASILGAGWFTGMAGRGATQGLSAYVQLIGEGMLGGIAVACFLGPFLAKYKYYSMAHFIGDYICGKNPAVRRIAGVANLLPNMLWAGGQVMGVSYILYMVLGIDYKITALIIGFLFVFYTMCGGIETVIATDALHGSIAIVTAVLVVGFAFSFYDFDFGAVRDAVVEIEPAMWSFDSLTPLQATTAVLTGFFGQLANPIFWNRAFTAKDVATCRKGFISSFALSLLIPVSTIMVGLIAFTFNQDCGDQAMAWLVVNKMPGFMVPILAISILAAALSTADTHLNCASANIVADIIDPQEKLPMDKTLKYSRIATFVAGIASVLVSLYADMIYDLANFGFTVCGGVLIPVFLVGYWALDKTSETYKSKLSGEATMIGMVLGIAAAVIFQAVPSLNNFWGGGIIPGLVMTFVGLGIGSMIKPAVQK